MRIWYIVNSSRSLNVEGVKCEFAQFTLHTCLVWGAQLWKTETARQDSLKTRKMWRFGRGEHSHKVMVNQVGTRNTEHGTREHGT